MALTPDQYAYAETHLGAGFNEAAIEARSARTGHIAYAVREQLQVTLAALRNRPTALNIPGEYADNVGGQIDALERALASIPAPPPVPGDPAAGAYAGRLVRTDRR